MKSKSRQKWSLRAFSYAIGLGALLWEESSPAQFSSADADTMMSAYNAAFYTSFGSGNAHYKNDQNGGVSYFWTQAETIEGVEDAYGRSGNVTYSNEITALLNGFSSDNGTDWSWNKYNDDICWACIAYLRGYLATGNTSYRKIAKANYDMMYARAWDTTLGGGLWWSSDKGGKNACVNGPGAIVAYLLSTTLGDSTYLTKAQSIFAWEKATLFNASNGAIYDNITTNGVNTWSSTYNQGTFVGAADYLGDAADAQLAANYMMGSEGLLPDYGVGGNNSGFNSIGMRWVAKFMKDHNLQNNYLAALQFNANTAFRDRRTSDNLSWCSWKFPTPRGTLESWSCLDSVVALQVVPPSFPYTWVTNENGTVNFETPVDVAFGVNGNYVYQYGVSGNINFNTTDFGDPNFGVVKSGFYAPFTQCATDGGSTNFTVPVEAAYGAQGKYYHLSGVSGTTTFNSVTFGGDSNSGVVKAGYYMPYTFCSNEGQSNIFTVPTYVAFGANGHYFFKTNVTGTIVFNTATFGDPIPGTTKMGYCRPITIPPALGIANASFETPSVGANSYQYDPTGGSWTFSPNSGIQANGSAWGVPTAPAGTQTAFLQIHNVTNLGTISQAVCFGSPGAYVLSFNAAVMAPPHNTGISLRVLVDNTVVGTYSPTTTNSFTSYTASFNIATAGNHTLQLAAVGTAADSTVFVDGLGLSGVANASFETPNVAGGYWYNPPGGSWIFNCDSGIQGNGSAWGAPQAPAGSQTAFLQIQNGTNNGSLWQMAFCTAGTHTLSFKAALRASNNGAIAFNVVVDGAVVGTYSPTTTTYFTSYITSPFNVVATGYHSLQFNAVGSTAVDASVFIDSVSINPPPSVWLTSPVTNVVFSAAAPIRLTANVSANENTINGIGFYANGSLLAQVTSPYTYVWSNVPTGPSIVFARLVFNGTNNMDTPSVTISVTNPPTVTGGIAFSTDGWSLGVQGTGLPNCPYYLNTASNLSPPVAWIPLLTNQSDASGNIFFTNLPTANPQLFFRLSTP